MTDEAGAGTLLGKRALVVGAGMGGMMAAQVLSKFFEGVVVLDKDGLPGPPTPRQGVPQGFHVHALLVQGRRNLERLFPGVTSELVDRGAVGARAGLDFLIHDPAGWQPRRNLELAMLFMSRPLLEGAVRDMLGRNPRIEIRDNTVVEGWQFTDGTLTGVIVGGDDGPKALRADFVIDATGRSSNSLSWLEAGGFGPVEETTLEIGTGYASAIFRKPADWQGPADSLSISSGDPDTRGGFIFSVEDDCWLASLTGRFDQAPPGDPDMWMEYARNLCVPEFYERVSQGERITPIKVYRAPISRWRRYEKLARHPERVLPVGDALAHVNPVYGQGMTLASVHVMGLWDILAERAESGGGLDGLALPYFANSHAFTKGVWEALESVEFGYAKTKGERPADIDMRIAFTNALRELIVEDAEAHKLMFRVGHLVDTGEALMRPDIIGRVTEIIRAKQSRQEVN
jgi:2-polyprenyl-6-methoxyphenol hydroxylase-like FAD-dependent oxidoreductase